MQIGEADSRESLSRKYKYGSSIQRFPEGSGWSNLIIAMI